MQPFKDFDKAKESAKSSGIGRLPAGAYACKIIGVKLTPAEGDKSGYITIQFDITDGEYKDFFQKQFKENTREDKKYKGKTTIYLPKEDGTEKDSWTKNTFAKWTNALEESNKDYVWDWNEAKWKDKKIGIVFGETGTRIEGKDIVYTEARFPVAVDKIGSAPAAKFKAKGDYGKDTNDGFITVPDDAPDELPF